MRRVRHPSARVRATRSATRADTCGSDVARAALSGLPAGVGRPRRASVRARAAATSTGTDRARRPDRLPSWLTEPDPLSVWLGGVKYLGGHAERDQPVRAAGLLLDRRGIHVRAFAELFTIRWDDVRSIDIEGPLDISERLTMTAPARARCDDLGDASGRTSPLHTANGDAIFEVDGLGPPELHARFSRVLQGLQPSERRATPIAIERPTAATPAPAPAPAPARPHRLPSLHRWRSTPSAPSAPLEVLVVDALWKLAHLREVGLLDETEVEHAPSPSPRPHPRVDPLGRSRPAARRRRSAPPRLEPGSVAGRARPNRSA